MSRLQWNGLSLGKEIVMLEQDIWEKLYGHSKMAKHSRNWILEGRIPRECRNSAEVAKTWSRMGSHIRENYVGGIHVSTVFLRLDHNYHDGPPILFETMVFGGKHDQYQRRYTSWDEAVLGHREILHEVNKVEWDRLYGDMWEYLTGVFIMKWFVEKVIL